MRAGQPLDLFRERHRRAGILAAAEPADDQLDHDPRPAERDVDQPPPIPAVHPRRRRPAVRAGHPLRPRTHPKPQLARDTLDPVQ